MIFERIRDRNDPHYADAMALYRSAFPPEERRDEAEHLRAMGKRAYHMTVIKEDDDFVGIAFYWETPKYLYLEHFAILSAMRDRGIGAGVLDALKAKGKTILLEIEKPEDELTRRRCAFYRRSGFELLPFRHIQAKLRVGEPDLELKLMAFPEKISEAQYAAFKKYLTKNVGIRR